MCLGSEKQKADVVRNRNLINKKKIQKRDNAKYNNTFAFRKKEQNIVMSRHIRYTKRFLLMKKMRKYIPNKTFHDKISRKKQKKIIYRYPNGNTIGKDIHLGENLLITIKK